MGELKKRGGWERSTEKRGAWSGWERGEAEVKLEGRHAVVRSVSGLVRHLRSVEKEGFSRIGIITRGFTCILVDTVSHVIDDTPLYASHRGSCAMCHAPCIDRIGPRVGLKRGIWEFRALHTRVLKICPSTCRVPVQNLLARLAPLDLLGMTHTPALLSASSTHSATVPPMRPLSSLSVSISTSACSPCTRPPRSVWKWATSSSIRSSMTALSSATLPRLAREGSERSRETLVDVEQERMMWTRGRGVR